LAEEGKSISSLTDQIDSKKTVESLVRQILSQGTGRKSHEILSKIDELERRVPIAEKRASRDEHGDMGEWVAWNTLVTLDGYPFEIRGQCRRAHLPTTLGRLVISLRDLGAEPDIECGKNSQ